MTRVRVPAATARITSMVTTSTIMCRPLRQSDVPGEGTVYADGFPDLLLSATVDRPRHAPGPPGNSVTISRVLGDRLGLTEPLGDHRRDAVAAHRHPVEGIGDL